MFVILRLPLTLFVGVCWFSLEYTTLLVEGKVVRYVGDALVFLGAGIMIGHYLA